MKPREVFSLSFLILFLLFAAAFAGLMHLCAIATGGSIRDWYVPFLVGLVGVFLLAVLTPICRKDLD